MEGVHIFQFCLGTHKNKWKDAYTLYTISSQIHQFTKKTLLQKYILFIIVVIEMFKKINTLHMKNKICYPYLCTIKKAYNITVVWLFQSILVLFFFIWISFKCIYIIMDCFNIIFTSFKLQFFFRPRRGWVKFLTFELL